MQNTVNNSRVLMNGCKRSIVHIDVDCYVTGDVDKEKDPVGTEPYRGLFVVMVIA